MGQAKRRGTYEQRKAEATKVIVVDEVCMLPKMKRTRPPTIIPALLALAAASSL